MECKVGRDNMKLEVKRSCTRYRHERFYYFESFFVDIESNDSYYDNKQMAANLKQVYNKYKIKHNIPFPCDIKDFRSVYSFTIDDLSTILNIDSKSLKEYEAGRMPSINDVEKLSLLNDMDKFQNEVIATIKDSKRVDRYLSNIYDVLNSKLAKEEIDIYKGIKRNIYNGYARKSIYRLISALHYVKSNTIDLTEDKLYSILFYSDVIAFKRNVMSISGLTYTETNRGIIPHRAKQIKNIFDDIESYYLSNKKKYSIDLLDNELLCIDNALKIVLNEQKFIMNDSSVLITRKYNFNKVFYLHNIA